MLIEGPVLFGSSPAKLLTEGLSNFFLMLLFLNKAHSRQPLQHEST